MMDIDTPGIDLPSFPHNLQAEQAVLCGILQNPGMVHIASTMLKPECFYMRSHQHIFTAAVACAQRGLSVDAFVVAIPDYLKSQGKLDAAGGSSYVIDLLDKIPDGVWITPDSFEYWCSVLLDYARRRETLKYGYEVAELAQDTERTDYIEQAQTQLMTLQAEYSLNEPVNTGGMMDQALANIEDRLSRRDGVTGLKTGIPQLDWMTHGFQPGQLISLGARPGGGKSALGMNIATHVVIEEQKPVLYFSLEMTGDELLERTLHAMAGTNCQLEKIAQAREALRESEHRFIIEDRLDLTIGGIQARIQKEKALNPDLALVVVDHLGLIASEPDGYKRYQNRAYELGNMTRTFKMLAKSLKIPILLLCQLNREIETRQVKKPQLSDLRDTGSIEMDSDIVLFTYIDRDESRQPTGKACLTIAKQRNGSLGEIPLVFIPHLTKFEEKSWSLDG